MGGNAGGREGKGGCECLGVGRRRGGPGNSVQAFLHEPRTGGPDYAACFNLTLNLYFVNLTFCVYSVRREGNVGLPVGSAMLEIIISVFCFHNKSLYNRLAVILNS